MPNLFNFGMPLQEGNTMTTFGLIPPTSSTKGDIGEHYLIPNITFHNLLYNQIWNGDNYYTKISTTENDYEIQLTPSDNWKTNMSQQLLVAEHSANILQPGHTYFIMADIRTEVSNPDWKNDIYDTYIEYNNGQIVKLENILSNNENSLRLQTFIVMPNIEEEDIVNKKSLKIVIDCNQNSTKEVTTAYISNITCLDFTKDIPLILQQNNSMFSEQEWYNFINKYSKTFNNESNIYQYSNHCYICNGVNDNRYEWYLTDNAHGINSLIRGIPTNPPIHGIKDIYNWEFLDGETEIPLTNIDANSILWQTAVGQYTAKIPDDSDIDIENLTYLSCVVDKNKNIFNFFEEFKEGNNFFHIYYTDAKGEQTILFLKNVYTTNTNYYYRIQESKDYLYIYIDNKIIEISTNDYAYKTYTLKIKEGQQPIGEIYTGTPNFFNNNHWEKREILFYNNFIFIYIHQPAPSGGTKDTDYLYMGIIDKNSETIELQQIDKNIFRLCYIQTPQGLYPYWLRYGSTLGHASSYTEQQFGIISLVSFKDDSFDVANDTPFIVSTVFNDTCYYTSGSRRNFRSPRTDYLTINDKPIYSVFSLNAYHSRSDVMSSYPWANGYGFYHIVFIPDLHKVIHVNSKMLDDDIKDERDYYTIRINRSNTSLQIGIRLTTNGYYKYDFTLISINNNNLQYNSLLSNVDKMSVSGISSTSLIPAGNRFSPFENQTFAQTHWIFSNGYYIANTNYLNNLPSPNFHSYFGKLEKYLYINYFLTDYDNLDLKIDVSNNKISSSQNVNIAKVTLTLDGDQLFNISDNQYWLKVRDE